METYKTIPNYTNYEVSDFGNVRNKKTGIILSKGSAKHRYEYVALTNDEGKMKSRSLHLFVAEAFVPNDDPEHKKEVNHKDRNKKNNIASNLEWVTHSENVKHTVKTGRKISNTLNKKCQIIFESGEESEIFNSFTDAGKFYNAPKEIIQYAANKKANNFLSSKHFNEKYKVKIINDDYDNNIIWKQLEIDGFKHLEACEQGIIRNIKTKKQVVGSDDGRYKRIKGDKSVKSKSLFTHRIIAMTFIDNPDNKSSVNHIDGDTYNNNVNNLEWATHSENMVHAINTGLVDRSKNKHNYRQVYQLELNGEILNKFDGIVNAEKYLNNNCCGEGQSISTVCGAYKKNIYKTSAGYGWCYIDDYEKSKISETFKNLFPELIDRKDINYNVIRKYIINISRPIWQIDIDGTKIKQFESINLAADSFNIHPTQICKCLNNENYLVKGFMFKHVSYEDIIDPNSDKIKNIPQQIKDIFNIKDDNVIIHPKIIKLLKGNVSSNGDFAIKSAPVIQETFDHKFINAFPNASITRKTLGLGRETVEAVLRGKSKSAGGFNFRYLTLNDPVLDLI